MTPEELMKPRYKVIALYPYPCPFVLGQILLFVEKHQMLSESGWTKVYDDFPHLFKKLQWWEERKDEDMPEYVKFIEDYMKYKKGAVYKYSDWNKREVDDLKEGSPFFCIGFIFDETKESGKCAVPPYHNQLMPATKEQYEAFKTQPTHAPSNKD